MDDDPRDAWLQHALRHAPDSEAAPPPALREAILQQARGAVAPAGGPRARFAFLAAWLARPPVATGLASVMLAVVIGGLWRGAFEEERADALPQPASRDARGTRNVAAPAERQHTPSAADEVAQKERPAQVRSQPQAQPEPQARSQPQAQPEPQAPQQPQPQPPPQARPQPQPTPAQAQPRRRDTAEAPAAPKAERAAREPIDEARREAAAPSIEQSALGSTAPAPDPLAPVAALLETRGPALHWTWRSRSRAHDVTTRAWFDAARNSTTGRWQRAPDAERDGAPLQLLDGTRVQAEFRLNSQRLLLLHPTLGAWQAPLAEADAVRLRTLADGW